MSKVCPRKQMIYQRLKVLTINQNVLKHKSHLVCSTQMPLLPVIQCITFQLIHTEVQNRLRQLAGNAKPCTEKIKSQTGGSVDVFVSKRVNWPHEVVLSGQNKDRLSNYQLSTIRWMAGFYRTIRGNPMCIQKKICWIT